MSQQRNKKNNYSILNGAEKSLSIISANVLRVVRCKRFENECQLLSPVLQRNFRLAVKAILTQTYLQKED